MMPKLPFFESLSLALLLSLPCNLSAQSGDVEIDVKAIARSIDEFGTRLEQVRSAIDDSRFEPDAMVDRLDYDAELLIEFAGNGIVFQPYEGVLRGPAGALRARAGNSLDQSVLLAYLLKSAGYDARVARGSLTDEDAARLLQQTGSPSPATSLDYLGPKLEEVWPEGEITSTSQLEWSETGLFHDTQRITAELGKLLAAQGIELKPGDASAKLLPMVKTYFWVQHRDGPAQEWQDAHPAFGGEASPKLEPEEFFSQEVPEKYHHTIAVSAWIEQWQAGSLKKVRVMNDWHAPTANLNAQPLRYQNAPNGLTMDTASKLGEAIANTTMLTPMLNGAVAPGARVFDLKGRTVDPFALSGGAAGVFQTLGDKLESATSNVSDPDGGQPILALHSMYLEFTYTSPSGLQDTRRRYLVPPRDDYSGDPKTLLWRLITDHTYMVATGSEPVDYVADRYLNTAIESLDWLKLTIRKSFEPETQAPVPDDMPSDVPPLAQYWLMDRRPVLAEDVIAYRAVPGLIGIRRGYRDANTAFAAVDVVWNRIEHLRAGSTGLENLPQSALASGVWDTVLESVPSRALIEEPITVSSAARVFELASEQGTATVILTPSKPGRLGELSIDNAAKLFIQNDLERGYVVVLPERVPEGARMAGWWRVHPETGETLGMTGDGYGAEAVEYMMDLIGIAKGLVDALQSIVNCDKKTDNVQKMCCLVEAHINNVAGLGFGSLLGATMGTVTATVFDIVNTATTAATEAATGQAQGLMPQANLGCDKMQGTDW